MEFNGNPNRLISQMQETIAKLGDSIKGMEPALKSMEKDKEYRFTYKGKKGTMLTLKSKIISLEIEGVSDEDIRDILTLLNDRHT